MAGTKYFSYEPANPTLRDAPGLASQFGNIDYDESSIKKKFNDATTAEYASKNKEFRGTEDLYYNNLYSMGQSTAQSVRSPYASAIMNGQNLAAMATPQLSAMMNLQAQGVAGATELARARNLLKEQEAAAYTKNVVDADTTSNQRKFDLGNLASNLYGSDMQGKAASDAYWAALEQGQAAYEGTKYASDASVRAAQIAADAQSRSYAGGGGSSSGGGGGDTTPTRASYNSDPVAAASGGDPKKGWKETGGAQGQTQGRSTATYTYDKNKKGTYEKWIETGGAQR